MGPQGKTSVGSEGKGCGSQPKTPAPFRDGLLSSVLKVGLPSRITNKQFCDLETKFENDLLTRMKSRQALPVPHPLCLSVSPQHTA